MLARETLLKLVETMTAAQNYIGDNEISDDLESLINDLESLIKHLKE